MSLVQLSLTVAERNVVETIFASLQSVKADSAPMVKHIRRELGVKDTRKRVDRFNNGAAKLGFVGLSWGDLMDNRDYMEFLEEQLALAGKAEEEDAAKRASNIEKLIERLHELNETGEFSVDTLYVRWLRDLMNDPAKVDLARRVSVSQTGQVQESSVPPSPDMIEAFADLLEKLGDALAA